MRVESSLAEMLMNAIAAGRVWGVQFMRKHGKDPGDERRTFEALNRVIEKRLDSALAVARENGQRELAEQRLRAEDAESRLGEAMRALEKLIPACRCMFDTGSTGILSTSCRAHLPEAKAASASAAQAGATLPGQTKASRSGPNLSDARRAELGYGRITLRLPLDALAILADEAERSGYTRGELVDAAIRAHCKGPDR